MRSFLQISLVIALLGTVACSSDTPPDGTDMAMGDATIDMFVQLPDFPPGLIKQIQISPAAGTLEVESGAQTPTQQFTAVGITDSNEQIPISAGAWTLDKLDIGSISATGLFTPSGSAGGTVKVSLKVGDVEGTATLNIKLTVKVGPEPPPPTKTAFDEALVNGEEDPMLSVIYPYNNTVFPRGLSAPVLQWTGGSSNDLYRIRMTAGNFDLTAYTMAAPPSSFAIPGGQDGWDRLTATAAGSDVEVSIQRYDGNKAFKPKKQTWKISTANLRGTIYYTELAGTESSGKSVIKRIQPGGVGEEFLEDTGDVRCVACHSISGNGSRMVVAYVPSDGQGTEMYWSTYDMKTGKRLYKTTTGSWFEAISPNGQFVLTHHANSGTAPVTMNSTMLLNNYNSINTLATLDPPGENAPGHPAWSNDGKKIAFTVRPVGNDSRPIDFISSTLWITDVNLDNPGFSNTKKIVDSDSIGGLGVTTYPTFSPDSNWIAFMRAQNSRTIGANLRGQLWMTSPDGVTQIALKNVGGNPQVDDAVDADYGPSFHPIQQGGYMWLAFFSRRHYGHTNFNGPRQIWIAAVDAKPEAGKDPSHPAFYVTGQSPTNTNERPQFTVNPCAGTGESCEVGFDCCEGLFCQPGENGKPVCGNTKPPMCAKQGDRCTTAGNCCPGQGLDCINGVCDTSIQ